LPFDVDRPRYVALQQSPPKRELHPLLRALVKLAILYAVVYTICFSVEGGMRLKYGVGSVTAIEKRFSDRRLRAKALVERQKRLDAMTNDLRYGVYLLAVLFGTPIAMFLLLFHDIRLLNRLMRRVWYPFRWWAIGTVIMLGSGLTLFLGPFMKAQHFYDRVSPAELIESLHR
jgi:hypothetical protein